ncbi:MAG TPA: TetR/AcrR family transcriptional regulator [Trinickia sp.]|jgi:AcrR family transcriptional regulator|uniref:TetR/AcrR family transcriptional regulator n=1 Tax=Trinickia sp. TaxID=2571163 RepID=UPI002B7EA1DD|nr:TetR/AcrR family transcriptional regulator [Trinickia sp.]HTI17593.1 TetR/AcrR family transcriptional regulator [Trinickia sp.]
MTNHRLPLEPGDSSSSVVGVRERLLDAAEALVYAGGIHATGVDAIVRQSSTTRKSFYSHFESKDALVAAALARRHERWMHWFIQGVRRYGRKPRVQLLAMFDVLAEWFSSPGFHGCAFLNAAGEISTPDDPIRVVAREHKAQLLQFVQTLCEAHITEAGGERRQAKQLARQWLVLIDGAIGVALVSGASGAARDARTAAARLLDTVSAAPPRARTRKR